MSFFSLQKVVLNLYRSIFYPKTLISSQRSSTCPLVYFRSFSRATRDRLALYDYYTENVLILVVPTYTYALTVSIYHYIVIALWPIYQDVLLIQVIQYFVDFTIVYVLILYTLKEVMLFFKLLPFACYAWHLHVKEITRRAFNRVPMRHKLHPHKSSHSITLNSIKTTFFMREHTKLLVALVHFNRHFASVLIFWYYFSVLFISVFILCLLYFLPVSFLIKVYYNVVYVLAIGSFAFLHRLSAVIKVLYSCGAAGQLYRVQMSCDSGNSELRGIFQFKLKLMSYYEVLRTKKKVTFTFGHHARVNNRWLMEVKIIIKK